jgi:hypothetical protein
LKLSQVPRSESVYAFIALAFGIVTSKTSASPRRAVGADYHMNCSDDADEVRALAPIRQCFRDIPAGGWIVGAADPVICLNYLTKE